MAYRVRFRDNRGFTLGPIGFLIVTNLIIWLATSIRPSLFIGLLGLSRFGFPEQPWTIVTNIFVHVPFPSFGHIFANMLTLYFFGTYLLRLVGEKSFFIIYFLGGLLGNVLFLALVADPSARAIGASGAVFAVGGALTVLRPKLPVFIFPIPVPIPLWVAVLGGFLIISPGIAWQAHLGGLLLGLAAGFFFRRSPRFSL